MFLTKKIYWITALIILTAAVFYCYDPFPLYFQNDDFVHIPLSAQGRILQHNSFRPVCDLSVMLDYFLWEKKAWGYHFINFVLHLADCLLIFFLVKKLLAKYSLSAHENIAAWLVALLFFAYSSHSEAVFWILGRSASIGMFFFLLTIIFYLKRKKKIFFLLSLICMSFGWLSYESTWILPFFAALISVADIRLSLTKAKKERYYLITIIFLFIIYLAARFYFIGEVVSKYEEGVFKHADPLLIIINYSKQIMRSWLPPFENGWVLVVLFILITIVISASIFSIKNKRFQAIIFILILSWLVSLLPVVALGIDTKGTESERYLYLPSLFVCILIVLMAEKIFLKYWISCIILIMLLHIIVLFKNSRNYRFAGEVTRTIIEQIQSINKENLFVYDLPEEYHGALIFRVGFSEAVKWMQQGKKPVNIFVISTQQRNQHFTKNYRAEDIQSCYVPDSLFSITDKNNYACFVFTDSSLQVYK
jgi:hypothetical protein